LEYEIIQKDKLSDEDQNTLWDGIESFTQPIVGTTGRYELSFLLQCGDGEVAGGVQGNYDNFGWLWIDSLWVSESVRGRGYGVKLLNRIEGEAKKNGSKNSHLSSFSYQAADFYKKQGYTIFGELDDYPSKGHSRYWLKKKL
jgi:GNAT superfamily N-acetyltransferase